MTSDYKQTLLWAHQANIQRYRQLLLTPLTEVERRFVRCRLSEEQAAMTQLSRDGAANGGVAYPSPAKP